MAVIKSNYKPFLLIGLLAAVALLCQMTALSMGLVPYIIALKRSSALFSVVLGVIAFKERNVKQLLGIPDKWKVVALITFGYPAEGENRFPANFQDMRERLTPKKPIEKIVSFNTFLAPETK